jgi:hypothetical protein
MNHSRKETAWPEIALVAMTRVALGAGIGLLLAHRLSQARRAAAGWALLLFGIATTVPLAAEVFGDRDSHRRR